MFKSFNIGKTTNIRRFFYMSSYWIDSVEENRLHFAPLTSDIKVDVCVIGGGITGVSTAYLLAKSGLHVCILEKEEIAHHATGNTTAKITSQHDLFYQYLIDTFSMDFAKKYLNANEEAIKKIQHIIETEHIDCDFEIQDSYVFTDLEEEVAKIKNEVSAVNSLGFPAELVTALPIPTTYLSGIRFPNQAQFNPLKYVYGLCHCITQKGGQICEHSKVYDVKKEKDSYVTYTKDHTVTSSYVVLASHYPIINVPGFYFLKMYQEASYLIGVETDAELFDGMYINTKAPIMSFRTVPYGNKRLLLIGGSGHKVGTKEDISNAYSDLEKLAKDLYPDANVVYRWQTQDCIPLDKIPYIGEFSTLMPHMYVATGFKKWGMTSSNVAATIICDKILGKQNQYEDIFLSTRFKPIKNGTEFTNMLKQTTQSLMLDKFKIPEETLNTLEKEQGKIIELENTKIGVYRDLKGKFYAIKPICSHLGCELSWNSLEKTWDCPCHGSRFSYTGKSLYDPSIKDIDLLELE